MTVRIGLSTVVVTVRGTDVVALTVQPKAATTAARVPRDRPAASVTRTPVPGDATTISEVIRNSMLMRSLFGPFRWFGPTDCQRRMPEGRSIAVRGAAIRHPVH